MTDGDPRNDPALLTEPSDDERGAPRRRKTIRSYVDATKMALSRFVWRPTSRATNFLDSHNGTVTALATIAIAILTFFLARYASEQGTISEHQFEALHGQLEEMKNQRLMTVAQLRANMTVLAPRMTPVDEAGATTDFAKAVKWVAVPVFKNMGLTDAVQYSQYFEIFTLQGRMPQSGKECPPSGPAPDWDFTVVHAQETTLGMPNAVPSDRVEMVRKGSHIFVMVGHLTYRDIFPNTPTHHLDFCIGIVPQDLGKNVWLFPIIAETGQ